MAGTVTCFLRLVLSAVPRGGKLIVESKDKTRLKGRFDAASENLPGRPEIASRGPSREPL